MLPLAAIEDTLLQIGVAGGALLVLWSVMMPLVRAHIRTMEAFVKTQSEMAATMVGIHAAISSHTTLLTDASTALHRTDEALAERVERVAERLASRTAETAATATARHEQLLAEMRRAQGGPT